MRERADGRAVLHRDAGAEHDVGLDRDVLAELGVGGEMHRLRRHQRDAGVERRLPQALLHDRLRRRELRLGVDAAHFVLRDFERDRLAASCRARSPPRRSDRIRACDCRCRSARGSCSAVLPANAISPPLQSAIARSCSLASTCSTMRDELVALRHQPAVAGRVGGPKSEHRDGRAVGERGAQLRQRLRPDQRRVAEDHQNVVGAALDRSLAPPAPHARCRAARACTKICAPRQHARALRPRPSS